MGYRIGDTICINEKYYLVREPYDDIYRCEGCAFSSIGSNACCCEDVDDYKPIIFVEVGKEKESRLEYLLEVLNDLKEEEKGILEEIEKLGFIAW